MQIKLNLFLFSLFSSAARPAGHPPRQHAPHPRALPHVRPLPPLPAQTEGAEAGQRGVGGSCSWCAHLHSASTLRWRLSERLQPHQRCVSSGCVQEPHQPPERPGEPGSDASRPDPAPSDHLHAPAQEWESGYASSQRGPASASSPPAPPAAQPLLGVQRGRGSPERRQSGRQDHPASSAPSAGPASEPGLQRSGVPADEDSSGLDTVPDLHPPTV